MNGNQHFKHLCNVDAHVVSYIQVFFFKKNRICVVALNSKMVCSYLLKGTVM